MNATTSITPAPASWATLLSAIGLHKRYKLGPQHLHVLRGVDLSVRAGEWISIIGASGSGKSTLLHLLGGLDRPDQGQVAYKGRELFSQGGAAIDRYRNQSVGFVFQFYHLLPELSALENVLIGAMIQRGLLPWRSARSEHHERARQLLDRLGLSQRLKHKPNALSGGERQRVAIARALINAPAVLLADEPTGNLDAKTGGQILDVFRELHRQGQTIVMVTHDAAIAAAADRMTKLVDGRFEVER